MALGIGIFLNTSSAGVASASPVNPTYSASSPQIVGSAGSPDSITITGSYAGADAVDGYFATSTSATPPSEAQMIAGSGGNIVEQVVVSGYSGAQQDLTGFTNDSTPTHFHAFWQERNNGGKTSISTVALTDIDFTALGVTSADTTSTTTVDLVMNDTVLGSTTATAPWTVKINGVSQTIASVSETAGTITITISGDVFENGDTLTYSYDSGTGDLTDERGNALATITDASITNNVAAANATVTHIHTTGLLSATTTHTISSVVTSPGDYVIAVSSQAQDVSTVAVNGSAATKVVDSTYNGSYQDIWFISGATAGDIVVTLAGSSLASVEVLQTTNATNTGAVTGTSNNQNGVSTLATGASAPDGAVMIGFLSRWGGGSSADTIDNATAELTQDATTLLGSTSRITVGSGIKSGAGVFTMNFTIAHGSGADMQQIVALPKV